MSMSRRERRSLRGIGSEIRRCDPRLAAILDQFGRNAAAGSASEGAGNGDGGTDPESTRTGRGNSPWAPGGYTPLILF